MHETVRESNRQVIYLISTHETDSVQCQLRLSIIHINLSHAGLADCRVAAVVDWWCYCEYVDGEKR